MCVFVCVIPRFYYRKKRRFAEKRPRGKFAFPRLKRRVSTSINTRRPDFPVSYPGHFINVLGDEHESKKSLEIIYIYIEYYGYIGKDGHRI